MSSPDIAIPQLSAPGFDKSNMNTQHEVPGLSCVNLPPTNTTSPDHVVIDIPEPDMTPTVTDTVPIPSEPVVSSDNVETDDVATESVSLRCSDRERRPPRKFTYDELGEPLTLAASSFFQTLGVAFNSAVMSPPQCPSWSAVHEGTRAI